MITLLYPSCVLVFQLVHSRRAKSHCVVLLTARPSQCGADPALRGRHFSRAPHLLTPPCGVSLTAARQEPASLEKPSAIKIGAPTTAGPALQAGFATPRLTGLLHSISPPASRGFTGCGKTRRDCHPEESAILIGGRRRISHRLENAQCKILRFAQSL